MAPRPFVCLLFIGCWLIPGPLFSRAEEAPAAPGESRALIPGPPWFQENLVYYNSFERNADQPEVTIPGILTNGSSVAALPAGLLGRGIQVRDPNKPFTLHGEVLSPQHPLTLSFWWALPQDMAIDGSFGLFSLTGKGYVGGFSRGKGEWCALQRPAGVLQVYYFPGIQNINDIYDTDLMSHLDLKAGAWHHTAVVFRRASTVEVYTDGKLVTQVQTSGREFTEKDGLVDLALGSAWGQGLMLDEVAILDRAVEPEMVADYYQGVWRLREYTLR